MSHNEIIYPDQDQYRKLLTCDLLDFPGSIFYQPDFLIIASEALKLKFKPCLCLSDSKVVGISNYLIGGRAGIKIAAIPNLFQYYGPIALTDYQNVNSLLLDTIKNNIDTAILALTPETSLNFNQPDWRFIQRHTYYLKLDNYKILKQKALYNARSRANKAEKAGVIFQVVDKFPYRLYRDSFTRHNLYPPIDSQTISIWTEKLAQLGMLNTFLAIVDSHPAAFISVLNYSNYGYIWLAGADNSCLKLGVNSFITLKAMAFLFEKGIKSVDMVGADIQSIAEFKKSFGGILMNHWQIERDFNLKGKLYHALMKLKAGYNG